MIQVVNNKNEKVGEIQFPDLVERVKDNKRLKLIQQSVINKLSSKRSGTAYAKPRAEVSYSTRKLFKQKGTGRARAGSRKSPVRVGGGTIFGPLPRDYSYDIPKKMRKGALKSAFRVKLEENNVLIIDDFGLQGIKTKDLANLLKTIGVNRSALILLAEKNEIIEKSSRNISGITVMNLKHPNAYDVLKYEKIILLQKDVDVLKEELICS